MSLLQAAHLCEGLLSPYLELCPGHQAGAVDEKDNQSQAENPQCRRGENKGINSGVGGKGRCDRKLQHPYLQGRAAVSEMHFKAYTDQEWK